MPLPGPLAAQLLGDIRLTLPSLESSRPFDRRSAYLLSRSVDCVRSAFFLVIPVNFGFLRFSVKGPKNFGFAKLRLVDSKNQFAAAGLSSVCSAC